MLEPKPITHAQMVKALAQPGEQIVQRLTAPEAHALHMAVGICGEAGELLDAIKKHVIYKKPVDILNVIEELGDIEFYLEGLRQGFDISREQVLLANMAKLQVRYASGFYSDAQAQARADKE